MYKPLKFKSYDPGLQRLPKSKKVSMPKTHTRGLVPQENSEQNEAVTERSENHEVNDAMFINPTLVDLSSDSCAALQLGDTCSAYNEASQVVYEHPHTSSSLALQSAQTACWQSAEVQSCFGVEECITVDSPRPSTNNSNHVTCPLFLPSPGEIRAGARTETHSPENLRDKDVSCHRWLQADQQPNNTNVKQQLAYDHDGVETTDERQTKRPKLASADEGSDSSHEDNTNWNDNGSGERAIMCYSKRGLDAATAQNVTLLSAPANIHSNACAFVPTCPSGQHSSRRREEATARQPRKAEASCSPLPPQQTKDLPGMQYMKHASQCTSCSTLRAALLEALSLLQHFVSKDVPSTGCEPEYDVSNSGYGLETRSSASTISCGDALNINTPSGEDGERSTIQVKVSNLSGQHRLLSQLEEHRLQAWRRENKSETWIASKLNNSKTGSGQVKRHVRQSSRRKRNDRRGRHCGTCGEVGHNARTCQETVETSSEDSEPQSDGRRD
ncbi:hypothetical protein J3458_013436 [Metarhizium acridum]|uniref:uncharacterized protein n=1 Tax=Metarhizium acridum TaxID=92637 RepID=UPI001C6C4342|nr:hypothetical protein J3458_013436 [Metarhizium acridum]